MLRFAIVLVASHLLSFDALAYGQEGPEASNSKQAANEAAPPVEAPADATVAELAKAARGAVAVIRFAGRDGSDQGLGTGFVIGADGLVATNLHVIGENRPISVQLADGKRYDVTEVHASDTSLDLALIKIDARDLPVLPLGDSSTLVDGQQVVALGNPIGLEHSVVAGVVSGTREIDGRSMIQLAIPIEPGNSGGPLLDMQGRVHGLLTMKSLVTANLGFAVPINALKPLVEKPNPIPIARWLTIGALDPREWTPLLGARWRQRAGHILVEGLGTGFGGRSLCLAEEAPPEMPYEVAVWVRLDDEAGAAGLVFHADGGDKHYGFYPTGGNLRLTRFEGPDVYSWHILQEIKSEHYRRGDWNHLKVRLEEGKMLCHLNDHLVAESADEGLTGGKVGLAKFRETRAHFRGFTLGRDLPPAGPSPEVVARVEELVTELPLAGPLSEDLIGQLAPDAPASAVALRERAARLAREAQQLERLATAVHHERVLKELAELVEAGDDFDLFHAGLLIARLDNEEVDIEAYRRELDRLAREVQEALPADSDDAAKLAALNKHLFQELGFHGSRADYYNRANSYLNEVLDDREGLPITLCVVYMELAGRLGLKVEGIGLPGHFVVRHVPAEGEPQLIDVYDGAKPLSREAAAEKVLGIAGQPLDEEYLAPVTRRAIVYRMLRNLLGTVNESDQEALLKYLDAILVVSPEAGPERWFRAIVRFRTDRRAAALADCQWLQEHQPAGVDLEQVQQLVQAAETAE
jgi:serine protease Do